MIDENYSSFTKTGPNKGNYKPVSPKITAKREKRAREREREKKKHYQQSLVFIVWTLEIVFKRQKTSAEGHSKTLSQSDLVFINPGIYLHSMAKVIGESAKKQFPAYVGEFWSMSQRLLEIIISVVWRQ